MSSEAVALYKQYAKAFAPMPALERQQILDATVATDVVYRTPFTENMGHDIILQDIATFQAKFPGGSFTLYSASEHHDVALMEWQLILADGTPAVRGHDAVRITPAGRLGSIVTFAPSTLESNE